MTVLKVIGAIVTVYMIFCMMVLVLAWNAITRVMEGRPCRKSQ